MNSYQNMKKHQETELNDFLGRFAFFAFNNSQMLKGLEKLGISKDEAVFKLTYVCGGCYILREKKAEFEAISKRHEDEIKAAIEQDKTGEGFIFDMFYYELANHEYGYTRDPTDALLCLPVSYKEIKVKGNLSHGYELAKKAIIEDEGD